MFNKNFKINNKVIGDNRPVYFIADLASNHDQNLARAKKLISLAKKSGADAVKFQHFTARTLVSNREFLKLDLKSHQSKWQDSTYNIYKKNELLFKWTKVLANYAKKIGIDFLTSPYSLKLVDKVNKYIPAFKIGSGDITYHQIIDKICSKKKPVIIATGASSLKEVNLAVKCIKKTKNKNICLMQCNTNYTASAKNFSNLNLKVLLSYKKKYKIITGLSDHTIGHLSVLSAVSMGASVIEKHFTDNNNRIGPDHYFSMNPKTWSTMVKKVRILELAMGDGNKKIEKNEKETFVIQRRCIILKNNKKKKQKLKKSDLVFLRPNIIGGYQPYEYKKVVGKVLKKNKFAGEALLKNDFK
ncbi:N-acetylneuraminate synthase family protein [Candidatus Pelagibacter ubique]|nr:N-acetylneuraminate synthase family protein [Candidatus Pelagibacter ubique]